MKHLFVGDIHGKVEIVRAALEYDGQVIFLGDFIDSFDRSVDEHRECYELVLNAIEAGKAQSVYGNHELSYLMPMRHKCSGWDLARECVIRDYKDRIQKLFKPTIYIKDLNVLVTHAGVTRTLWQYLDLTPENCEERLTEEFQSESSSIHNICPMRGGHALFGGIFWCDSRVIQVVPGIHQVVGHTPQKQITTIPHMSFIDCLDKSRMGLEILADGTKQGYPFVSVNTHS